MRGLILVCVFIGSLFSAPVTAQDEAAYAAQLAQGREQARNGHYDAAYASLSAARSANPTCEANFFLGAVAHELSRYPESYRLLHEALEGEARGHDIDDEQRGEAQRILDEARLFIGVFTVDVQPSNASVTVDGVPMQLERDGHLLLGQGTHRLIATHNGERAEQLVNVPQHREGTIALHVATGNTQPGVAPLPRVIARTGDGIQPDAIAGWIAGGVFSAAAIGALILQANRASDLRFCEDRRQDMSMAPCGNEDAIAGENDLAVGLVGGFAGLGIGALASGLVLTLSSERASGRGLALIIAGGVSAVGVAVFAGLWAERDGALGVCGPRSNNICGTTISGQDVRSQIEAERNNFVFTTTALGGAATSLLGFGLGSLALPPSSNAAASVTCLPSGAGLSCYGAF